MSETIPKDVMKAMARGLAEGYRRRCPWNPFPRNSDWGRKVDEAWERDQAHRRKPARITDAEAARRAKRNAEIASRY